jgi:hypothetical protein
MMVRVNATHHRPSLESFSGNDDDDDDNDNDDELHVLYSVRTRWTPPQLVVAARQIDANMEMRNFEQKGLTKIVAVVDIKGVVGRQRRQESLW